MPKSHGVDDQHAEVAERMESIKDAETEKIREGLCATLDELGVRPRPHGRIDVRRMSGFFDVATTVCRQSDGYNLLLNEFMFECGECLKVEDDHEEISSLVSRMGRCAHCSLEKIIRTGKEDGLNEDEIDDAIRIHLCKMLYTMFRLGEGHSAKTL